jgi:hypothetical protein
MVTQYHEQQLPYQLQPLRADKKGAIALFDNASMRCPFLGHGLGRGHLNAKSEHIHHWILRKNTPLQDTIARPILQCGW